MAVNKEKGKAQKSKWFERMILLLVVLLIGEEIGGHVDLETMELLFSLNAVDRTWEWVEKRWGIICKSIIFSSRYINKRNGRGAELVMRIRLEGKFKISWKMRKIETFVGKGEEG